MRWSTNQKADEKRARECLVSLAQSTYTKATQNRPMKKRNRKHRKRQAKLVKAVFAELDEDVLAIGPRLFDDKYYDDERALSLEPVKKRSNYDKGSPR